MCTQSLESEDSLGKGVYLNRLKVKIHSGKGGYLIVRK